MNNLRCFISASSDVDVSNVKNILAELDVDILDIYDFSIGESIQQILKRKIRQADFAIFIVTKESANVIYEMGVCEGLGKQHFIFIDSDSKIPFYIESQLFLRSNLKDRNFLKLSIEKILHEVRKNKKPTSKRKKSKASDNISYPSEIQQNLESFLSQVENLRINGTGREFEYLIEEVFKTISFNYVENLNNFDKGVDFAIWNDELGKVIGNPIIVESKYGQLTSESFNSLELQVKKYVDQSDAKLALLLYLDKGNNRFKAKSTLFPLIISYDLEDFITDLIDRPFESIILNERNKIAHGLV